MLLPYPAMHSQHSAQPALAANVRWHKIEATRTTRASLKTGHSKPEEQHRNTRHQQSQQRARNAKLERSASYNSRGETEVSTAVAMPEGQQRADRQKETVVPCPVPASHNLCNSRTAKAHDRHGSSTTSDSTDSRKSNSMSSADERVGGRSASVSNGVGQERTIFVTYSEGSLQAPMSGSKTSSGRVGEKEQKQQQPVQALPSDLSVSRFPHLAYLAKVSTVH